MRGALSVAKVTRPKPIDIRSRARLYRRLDDLRRAHPVPWIVAPAGSGKTTLVASYVENRHETTLWYRVDESDVHAEDLFFYMRLAAEAFEGSRRAGVNLPSFSPGADIDRFSRRFFEALLARLPDRAIVVFDDYHLAPEESPWQRAIERGLGCIRTGISVVILSRNLPPATLARARVHGDIGLLETAELLFTENETIALGTRRAGRGTQRPTRLELLEIHAATGGWPAGVSLLLRRRPAASAHRLGADSEVQPIFDYLASTVFAALSAPEKRLLLCTAWLQRFTAQQAETLSGIAGARDALLALHGSGFLIERENTDAEVFRYHALFRAFLMHQATLALTQDELRSIRASAANLLRDEGRGEEAFELLLQLNDVAALRELLLALAPTLFAQGRVALLQRWLAVLPHDAEIRSPWLEYWRSMSLLMTTPTESRLGFERALDGFVQSQDGAGAYLAWAGGVQALTYEGRAWGAVEGWLERLEHIEQTCGVFQSPDVGSQVASSLVMALTLVGADSATVEHWSNRAISLAGNADAPSVRVMTASVLVLNYALRGDSGHAQALVAQLGRCAQDPSAGLIASVAARAATTALAWHRGDAKASLDAAREGLALMGDRQVPMWQSALLVFGSFAALDLEDLPQVHRFLERLAEIAECGTPLEVSAYHVVRAHEALARGDLSAAMLAIELSLDRDRALGFSYAEGKDLQLIAYIAFELLDPQRGRDALEAARRIDEEHADPILRHWRLLIESDRALYEGKRDDATRLLKEAFQIGRERQVFSAPCPAPERLAELCRVALREGIEPEYTRALIRRRRLRANPPPVDVDDWPWPLRIHALGRVEVVVDEVSATLGRGRMLPLLIKAIVVLGGRGRGVSTSEIVALLWPDAEGDAAMRVFEVTLLRLRKQLGPHGHRAIRLEGGEVRLDKSLCWTDADALRLLLKEISALESAVPPPQSDALRTLADRLMSLWHGPFVGPHELPSVLLAIDNRTVSRAASALRRLGERLEQAGDSGVAEATYVRALEAGLCHETLLAPAVRCMKRRGDASEASALVEMYRHQGIQSDEAEVLLRAPARQVARADPKL